MATTKWEAKHQAFIPTSTPDDVWSIIKHFANLQTLLPSIQTCQVISGEDGQPGCIRRCTGQPLLWAEEKLLSIDHVARNYTYEVLENNMGIKNYGATMAVGGEGEGGGSTLEWGYSADPVNGWSRELFDGYIEKNVGDIAKKVEEIILRSEQRY